MLKKLLLTSLLIPATSFASDLCLEIQKGQIFVDKTAQNVLTIKQSDGVLKGRFTHFQKQGEGLSGSLNGNCANSVISFTMSNDKTKGEFYGKLAYSYWYKKTYIKNVSVTLNGEKLNFSNMYPMP